MPASPPVETMTEAVELLQSKGYTEDLVLHQGGLRRSGTEEVLPHERATVDYLFRFEGDSDPGDMNIVLGVTCPDWHTKGILVSAYGPGTDPEHAEVLQALTAAEGNTTT